MEGLFLVVILEYTKCSVNTDTTHPLCSQIHYENILKSTQNFTYYFFCCCCRHNTVRTTSRVVH